MLHSCAAAANCTLPSDILSYERVDDLIVKPIEIRESYALVSDRPGLGVELDEDAVLKYQVSSSTQYFAAERGCSTDALR